MRRRWIGLAAAAITACSGPSVKNDEPVDRQPTKVVKPLVYDGETHFADVVQITYGSGENAEAYWSSDGSHLIFQSKRPPYKCDQIFTVPADGSADPSLVSTGEGRTTCSYYLPGDKRVLWSSTHEAGPECPPEPDHSQGYVWPLYASYDIYESDPDGGNIVRLTDSPAYDAEATICPIDGSIVFTSIRDGDIDLYRMDKDGKNVQRLTNTPGYDGGAFFSRDCNKIVWRASRPTGEQLEDYKALLAQGLVRPSLLELFVANADGTDARQVTYLGSASFAPYFHPSGEKILFSTNYPNPRGREFDIWSIDVSGANLERITYAPGFDGFPMFSPDGSKIAFASNRNNKVEGETDVYVARWVEGQATSDATAPAERFLADVRWLAEDERQGRGIGTQGIDASADWLESKFKELGVQGGLADGSYLQEMPVPVDVTVGAKTDVSIGRQRLAKDDFVPASFSTTGSATARTVFVGYGIAAPDLGVDDYKGKRVKGRVVVVRRFVPDIETFEKDDVKRRYSDLHYKAFTAREKGAKALVVIDYPVVKDEAKMPAEAPLPELSVARLKDVGIPVVIVKRDAGKKLIEGSWRMSVSVELNPVQKAAHNVVGVIRAGAKNKRDGVVVVGAHYDHLGFGGETSLEPGKEEPHNGADDNASGTAGLLEVARLLIQHRGELSRDVYILAFTAEESGLLGSSHFVHNLPKGLAIDTVVAMLNMDMIGRLRNNTVSVLGGGTSTDWPALAEPACADVHINCELSGTGYGPSDQTPFYAAGVPVLHFFTGAHRDYHKTTDDWQKINASGGVRVAQAVGKVALATAAHEGRLDYQKVAAPLPRGDSRSFGASLGTIPDYADSSGKPGVLLSGVRPGGPAEQAGIKGGDRLLQVGKTEVRTVQDLVYVLRQAEPNQTVPIWIEREGKKLKLEVTFGKSTRRGRR